MKKTGLTGWILIAMGAGSATGLLAHYYLKPSAIAQFSDGISVVTDVFLRLIKMIIAPLVFSTLVVGIAKLGDIRSVGRIGGKTLIWFMGVSLLSLLLGWAVISATGLGYSLHLPLPESGAGAGIEQTTLTFRSFITHVFPRSIVESMANNEILQIVVFAIFFGIGTAAIGEKGLGLIRGLDAVGHVILKVTGYVMNFAPFAAFSAVAAILAVKGPEVLLTYGTFILVFYLTVAVLWILLLLLAYFFLGRKVLTLTARIKDAVLLAFSTASSEAAFPRLMDELERFGCPNKIVSFVLPLGYSFNLCGSMLYMTFGSLFIAQAYGITLSAGQQLSMLLVLMLTSKGMAGVPRAALVVIAGTLALYNIPQQGLLLLLGIDQIMDMARSATNVLGNGIATVVVSRLENALEIQQPGPDGRTSGTGIQAPAPSPAEIKLPRNR
jgi:Na+/H+-dicarboxylate symporter